MQGFEPQFETPECLKFSWNDADWVPASSHDWDSGLPYWTCRSEFPWTDVSSIEKRLKAISCLVQCFVILCLVTHRTSVLCILWLDNFMSRIRCVFWLRISAFLSFIMTTCVWSPQIKLLCVRILPVALHYVHHWALHWSLVTYLIGNILFWHCRGLPYHGLAFTKICAMHMYLLSVI